MKNIRTFYLKIFIFLVVKFSVYLNRHVFVMFLLQFVAVVNRGCKGSATGGEVCDTAPTLTVCYCKTDLCNTGSTSKVTFTLVAAFGVLLVKYFI